MTKKKGYVHVDVDLLVLDIRSCLCEFDSDDAILSSDPSNPAVCM